MKKKILVDLLNLATPEIAGVGVFARNLFELWLPEEKSQYQIVFYSSYVIDAEKVFHFRSTDDVVVKKVNVKHVLARFLYQQIVLPFKLITQDLYYNPTLGLPFLARIIAPRTKLVVTIHDLIPFFYAKKYSRMRSVLVKIMSKQAARAAHRVVTVSENSKKDIINIAGISPDKITIVYNFIRPPYDLTNTTDENFFLCISTLEPGKNVENTIRGFGRFLKKSKKPFKFYWVGRIGWVYSQKYLDDLIKAENLEGSFILTGYVTEGAKKEMLRNCTAIVYLSHYEGFGLPVLEGMTLNKPAVVSDNSSLPEVVGKAGVICDPVDIESISNALVDVVENRSDLMKGIPSQLDKFLPDKQIKVFKQTIKDLLK